MGLSDPRRDGIWIEEGGWGIWYGGGRRYEGGGLIRIKYEFTGKEHVEHNTTIG